MLQEALNLVGNAMTYSLFECVKERYFDLITEEPEKDNIDNKESTDCPDENVCILVNFCLSKI